MRKIGKMICLAVFGFIIITTTLSITILLGVNPSSEEGKISLRSANDDDAFPILESNFTWGYEEAMTRGVDIEVDSSGNMYVGGVVGNNRVFLYVLVKFDFEGNELWNCCWETGLASYSFYEGFMGIALDKDENIYYISTYLDYYHDSQSNLWLFKFNPEGEELWNLTWSYTEDSDDYAFGITLDDFGNLYVCGSTEFPGIADRLYVVKFNSNGEEIWRYIRNASHSGENTGLRLDLDGFGNIYVAAYLEDNQVEEFCIVKLNPEGQEMWDYIEFAESCQICWSIAVDSTGNSYLTGFTLDDGSGEEDLFVYKLSPSGEKLWNATWGGALTDIGFDIALDGNGDVYVSGTTYSYGQGEGDICLIKYSPTGTLLWNMTWGGVEPELGGGILIDDNQNIYVTGMSYSLEPGGIVVLKFSTEDQGNGEIPPNINFWMFLFWILWIIFH